MLKLAGVILLLAGAAGFSYSLCNDRKRQLQILKEIRYMYQLIQNEIRYTKVTLPEICKGLAETIAEPFGNILKQIGEEMTLEQEEGLVSIWKSRMQEGLKDMPLTKEQKKALLRFPECINLADCDGQAKALQRQIEELSRGIVQLEEEEKSKNKVIMSLGIAVGVFLVILLL